MLFTDQIFINSLQQNPRPSACFKTLARAFETLVGAFQTLGRAFEGLRENQKLDRVFKKLSRIFLLQRGPFCPNQPRNRVHDVVNDKVSDKQYCC